MAEEQGLSAENVRLTQMHASFMLSYGESFRHRLNDLLNAARSEGRAKPPQGEEETPQPPVVGSPAAPDMSNAGRTGWNAYFAGRAREAVPFPPARADLTHSFHLGWDLARREHPRWHDAP